MSQIRSRIVRLIATAAVHGQPTRAVRARFFRMAGLGFVIALTATSFLALTPVPTRAATLPLGTAQARPFNCVANDAYNGNEVFALPPQMTTVSGQLDNVYWSPDLWRWNGNAWAPYDTSKPWAQAAADRNGTIYSPAGGVTWFRPPTITVRAFIFANLTPGYYLVVDYYQWENGARRSAYVPYSQGGSYCYFR